MIDSLQQISQQITSHKKNSDGSLTASPVPASLSLDLKKLTDQLTILEKDSSQISSQLRQISIASQKNYYWLLFLLAYLGFQLLSHSDS
jgi:hypothetical protein